MAKSRLFKFFLTLATIFFIGSLLVFIGPWALACGGPSFPNMRR